MNYIEENKISYDDVYKKGWGNRYPNSNMISYYFNYVKPLLSNLKSGEGKMLDFGCSLGANTKFFYEQGFQVYGIDISQVAIEKCIEYNKFDKTCFKSLNILQHEKLEEIFQTKFDLIVALDVLYYFSKNDVQKILSLFYEALTDHGIIYANWVTYQNDIYRKYKDKAQQGEQIKVSTTGSMDEELNVYVVENKKELLDIFNLFELKYIKSTIIELEGKNESLHYIGMKR